MELQEVQPSYIDKLKDELDIDPKSVSDSPQWLANTTLGKYTYNGLTYEFRYTRDGAGQITGAMVKPIHTQRAYAKDDQGRTVKNPDNDPDHGKEFYVTKAQLNKMLNQEAPPSGGQQGMPPMQGGMPGGQPMPGMGGM